MSNKEQKVTVPTIDTKQVSVPTVAGLKKAAAPAISGAAHRASDAAHKAGEWGSTVAHDAGDWAKPRIEHGKASAEPMFTAASGKTNELVERFNESMPKLSEAILQALQTGTNAGHEAARRSADAALVLRGEADIKRKKKSRGILKSLCIATLVLVTAGVAGYWFKQRQAEADDPWARPLTDPYAEPTSGRDSSVGQVSTTSEAPVDGTPPAEPEAVVVEDVIEPASGQVPAEGDAGATTASDRTAEVTEVTEVDEVTEVREHPDNPSDRTI